MDEKEEIQKWMRYWDDIRRRLIRCVHMREARAGHGRSGTGAGQIGFCRWETSPTSSHQDQNHPRRGSSSPWFAVIVPAFWSSYLESIS
jgi:hypothetical protein